MARIIARPWVVLLAAGASRRFGRPKQLARVGGESLLRRAARTALDAPTAGCIVVLGARAPRLAAELAGLPVGIAVNARWRSGLSGSLRTGIAALPRTAPAALVMLADQPAIGRREIAALVAAWQKRPRAIVTSCARGVRGPPAIFPRALFPRLSRLRGEAGARTLLRDPARHVLALEMPEAAVDVDRPADLEDWRRG